MNELKPDFENLSRKFSDSMPDGFEFYHLGRVESAGDWADELSPSGNELPLEDRVAVAYRIQGDAQGALLILFDKGLDSSLYMEMGNIIASRTATQLNRIEGIDVLVSPPQVLKEAMARSLLAQASPASRRRYLHLHEGRSISVETVILPQLERGQTGNA
jgi:hypothetical protein